MDCAGCAQSVKKAILRVPGVGSADVLLSSEKAVIIQKDHTLELDQVKKAVEDLGYRVPLSGDSGEKERGSEDIANKTLRLFGIVFGAVLLVVVAGEWMGLFKTVTNVIPIWLGTILVLLAGYPVFKKVVTAAFKGDIIAHTLMAVGAIAALVAGEWVTAAIVVFFMRTGDYIEHYTTEKARGSIRSLTEFAPKTATVVRDDNEREIPANEVQNGETVLVRPGGQVPVDGKVIKGTASVDQSAVTGESMPIEVIPGSYVYSASIIYGGRILLETVAAGEDSTFGRIIKMVEQAEAQKGEIQRFADQFSGYYLPVVGTIALLTYLLSGNTMATVAVLVVACSCAFALATPVALLASIGFSAGNGILIKGGKYIENLARADVLLLDKTGTITIGKPRITDIIPLNGFSELELLQIAASAERFSEHPLGNAVVEAAREQHITLSEPEEFEAIAGTGIRAHINNTKIEIMRPDTGPANRLDQVNRLAREGKTVMQVILNDEIAGLLAARDAERGEVMEALEEIRSMGLTHIELLTGDNEETARRLAEKLNLNYRAELLPEDKINIVKEYQSKNHHVIMIGDGINDAPALAQADVGIAMGATGTDVAIETAHIALMRDDWALVPDLLKTAYRTMRVIKGNFGFTVVYSIAGLSLAATGILPPILAAAAQSLPDVGILLNSSRLLKK